MAQRKHSTSSTGFEYWQQHLTKRWHQIRQEKLKSNISIENSWLHKNSSRLGFEPGMAVKEMQTVHLC